MAVFVAQGGGSGETVSTPPANRPTTSLATTTTSTLVPGYSLVATAAVAEIEVFDSPAAPEPSNRFVNPWYVNNDPDAAVPLVFHVEEQRSDGWLRVLLPIRPNSSTGWVRVTDVALTVTPYHITIELAAHRLTVYHGEDVVLTDTVAIGAPETPTPPGRYYIRALLEAPNPKTLYGPYAYGLSGYSETLEQFAGGDAELGIHGNNNASLLGKDVSAGCVRMSNDAITLLTKLLPLGTPVDIIP